MKNSMSTAVVLTGIMGVILSVAVFVKVQSWEEAKAQKIFEFSAQDRLAAIKTDLARHQQVVNSVAALFYSSEQVTRKEFGDFAQNMLKDYPHIQGLSWNPLIRDSERQEYMQKAREEGFADFEITELDPDGRLVKAGNKKQYVGVYYIEPHHGNEEALGFDIASHQGRKEAIIKARDTGEAVITERITLVQGEEEPFGYLLLKAVYEKGKPVQTQAQRREHFAGVVAGVFRFDDWVPYSMRGIDPMGVDIWISDLSVPAEKQLLYLHASRTRQGPLEPTIEKCKCAACGLRWEASLDVFGRKWSFLFAPAPAFHGKIADWHAWAFLLGGLAITFLALLYMWTKTRDATMLARSNMELYKQGEALKQQRSLLEKTVGERTRELQDANRELEQYKERLEVRVEEEVEKNRQQNAYLVQQSRLAQMGEMISMIAHQWRQPLSSISAISGTLAIDAMMDVYKKEFFLERLGAISDLSQHLSSTIDDFRGFFKESKEKVPTTLQTIVRESLNIIGPTLQTKEVEAHTVFEENETIETYPSELKQVVLNIIKNAEDILLEKEIRAPQIWIRSYADADMVCLSIEDNAGGISDAIIGRVFDPYFSTKEKKDGTGLGLYMSKMIIEEHCNGRLSVKNSEYGARFEIALPR